MTQGDAGLGRGWERVSPLGRDWTRRAGVMLVWLFVGFLVPVGLASADGSLDVSVAGNGSGVVTGISQEANGLGTSFATPGEIDCDGTPGAPHGICSASFDFDLFGLQDGLVTLTATPDPGSIFLGWAQTGASGSARCTTPPESDPTCRVDLNGSPGPTVEVTGTFALPPEPPLATTDGASAGLGEGLTTLNGRVNPGGFAVGDCHFVYGTTTDYGQSTPCDQTSAEIGSGTGSVAVSAQTAPLQPNTTYHFRLRAEGPGGPAQGKDRTFSTGPAPAESCPNAAIRAAQGIETLLLPDCMALELVSPAQKLNQGARAREVSANGNRVIFNSTATLGDTPSHPEVSGIDYVATRLGSGWVTESATVPSGYTRGAQAPRSFSPDFSRWFHPNASTQSGRHLGVGQAFEGGLGGIFSPVSTLLTPLDDLTITNGAFIPLKTLVYGASADRSRLFLAPGPGGNVKTTRYLLGDPVPAGEGEDYNVYVTQHGGSSPELLARGSDAGGVLKVWGGNCGARVGGIARPAGDGDLSARNGNRNQGAISTDGGRVYFSTRPAQPEAGNCNPVANKMRILQRVEGPAGPEISELIENECDRSAPACATHDGDDLYQGASVDQTRVYFTTNRQLTDSDRDGSAAECSLTVAVDGCDLYLYDSTRPSGERLTQVSAGDATGITPGEGARVFNSIAAISGDGSHVYFVALDVLTADPNPEGATAIGGQPNLYLWNAETRATAFIGTLVAGDQGELWGGQGSLRNGAYPVPVTGTNSAGVEVGGSGELLLFQSRAALTADDGDGGFRDVFRYDAGSEALERISTAATGGADDGAFNVASNAQGAFDEIPGTDFAEAGRWVSESGETIVLATAEALLPGDVNDVADVYLWRSGELSRLPGSRQAGAAEPDAVLSHDGSTVLYQSNLRLLPVDGDTVDDAYVARVNGGYPMPPPDPDCEGEDCQGGRASPLEEIGAATAAFSGRGNLLRSTSKRPRCGKGKRKVRRAGRVRCVKRSATKRANPKRGPRR